MKWRPMWLSERDKMSNETDPLVQNILNEIREAHRDWMNAQRHFEYAMGKDQVDYAIFAIEAAEKRYEMLLRHAKTMSVTWPAKREGETG